MESCCRFEFEIFNISNIKYFSKFWFLRLQKRSTTVRKSEWSTSITEILKLVGILSISSKGSVYGVAT